MFAHIRVQDHVRDGLAREGPLLCRQSLEDVGIFAEQNAEAAGGVMVLQWTLIIVQHRKFGHYVGLERVAGAGVLKIMA